MKIAITGGTAGIGQALAKVYESQGHEVMPLSRRNGYNIRSTPKVADAVETCDMFVNNAQAGYAQTELLFEMAKRWQGTGKTIINISTAMTQNPVSIFDGLEMLQYRLQKVALEDAVKQLRHSRIGVRLVIVRPGLVNTQPNQTMGIDPDAWAKAMVDTLANPTVWIDDITIHPRRK